MMIVGSFPGRTIHIKGRDLLYFGGTSYLGMATHPEFQEHVIAGIKQWGTFYGSSRTANVQMAIYEQAENLFCEWIGTDSAAVISSGALAGQMVIEQLSRYDTTFYHYPKTHPAIMHSESLPLLVDGVLHPELKNDIVEDIVISADAMRSLEVFVTPFDFLDDIHENKNVTLIVDESHTLGVSGKRGRGIFKDIKNTRLRRKIMVSSIGKALGLSGGVIASDAEFVNTIRESASFISSSGPNAGYLEAFIRSQHIYDSQLEELKSNMEKLFSMLDESTCEMHNKDYPVLYFNESGFYQGLLEKDIVITSFKYPSYEVPMNRIVITSAHEETDLVKLASAIGEVLR